MIWKCLNCNKVHYSIPFRHHAMDYCECEQSGVDLETYGCRIIGEVSILKEINGFFDEILICMKEQGFDYFIKFRGKLCVDLIGHFLARNLEDEILKDYIKGVD